MAQKRLMSELQALQKEKWVHIEVSDDQLFKWDIGLMVVNPESIWHGSYLKARMTFSNEYPYEPPNFWFLTSGIFHPNIYPSGRVCISILHQPGVDEMSGEDASERWSPLQGVESVLRSVLLLLDAPEIGSPANVDAGVLYRDKRDEYSARAHQVAADSRKDMPESVSFPTSEDLVSRPEKTLVDDNFWADSDDDFNGSDFDFGDDDDDDDDDDE